MTIPSRCHISDRPWHPERESIAQTLTRIGAPPPTFDRLTFLRKIGFQILRDDRERPSSWPVVHMIGAKNCPVANGERTSALIKSRTVPREKFEELYHKMRCQRCNEFLTL